MAGHVAVHDVVVTNVDGLGHVPPQLACVNTYCVDTIWPRPDPSGQPAVHGLTTVNVLNTQLTGPLAHAVVGQLTAAMHGADWIHVEASGQGVPPLLGAVIMYRVCVVVPGVEPHSIEHWLGALQPLITHGPGVVG